MQFGELIPLIGAVLNLSLAIFVLLQNPRATILRVYFLLGVSFAVWNYGTFWMFRVHDREMALFWARFLQFGVIFIPLTLFHISFLVAQVRLPRWVVATAYGFHLLLFGSNFTGFFLAGVRNVGYAWYSVAGTGFWILFGIFPLMWVSVGMLLWYRRTLPVPSRRRVTPLIIAQAAIAFFGCNDALPILGYDYYPFTTRQIYPFGSMAVIFYGMIVGYSVLQHQLLEVRITLGRSTAKAIRMLFIFFTGLCVLLILWLIHPQGFTIFSFFAGLAALMIGAGAAATLFPKLFGDTSEVIERRLLGDTFEYEDQVRKFIESMTWYSDVNLLLNDLHDLLTRVFNLASYHLILRDETNRLFEVARSHPVSSIEYPELKPHSPVFRYFEWTQGEYLPLNKDDVYTRGSQLARQGREQLAVLQGQFCFALSSEGEIFGLLVTGDKHSGEVTANDIMLLLTLVKSMSLIMNQIRLKTQVLRAQELELLGRMSRGMAHDLNNLLTPVWTLLQLSTEDAGAPLDEELLPVALRHVKTMRAYIKEALFFSENLRPDLQLGRLDLVVRTAIEVAQTSRPKVVEIEASTPTEILVEMDEVLIQRLIANLIANAIDASTEGALVRVLLERLPETADGRDWVRVRIVDHGEGIPKENLNRILTPYFTTKNRGDENRGFGLGLAICRKIVTLHGGNLAISSQVRKGTTVQVDLPSRQLKPAAPPIASATT